MIGMQSYSESSGVFKDEPHLTVKATSEAIGIEGCMRNVETALFVENFGTNDASASGTSISEFWKNNRLACITS